MGMGSVDRKEEKNRESILEFINNIHDLPSIYGGFAAA